MITTSYVQNDYVEVSSLSELGKLLRVNYLKNGVEVLGMFSKKSTDRTDIKVLFRLLKKEITKKIENSKKPDYNTRFSNELTYLSEFGLREDDILCKDSVFFGYSKPFNGCKDRRPWDFSASSNIFMIRDKDNEDSIFVLVSSDFPDKINLGI